MSTRCTTPHALGRRIDEVGDLVGAEGDRQVGAHVGAVEPTGVDVDPDGTSTATTGTPSKRGQRLRGLVAQTGSPADADDPVDHDVGLVRLGDATRCGRRRPAARRAPRSCTFDESSTASTAAPRRASIAPAHSASPPLSPAPTSSSTRAAYTEPSRSAIATASPVAARCISAPSGSRAISSASAARTCSTVCALRMRPR